MDLQDSSERVCVQDSDESGRLRCTVGYTPNCSSGAIAIPPIEPSDVPHNIALHLTAAGHALHADARHPVGPRGK